MILSQNKTFFSKIICCLVIGFSILQSCNKEEDKYYYSDKIVEPNFFLEFSVGEMEYRFDENNSDIISGGDIWYLQNSNNYTLITVVKPHSDSLEIEKITYSIIFNNISEIDSFDLLNIVDKKKSFEKDSNMVFGGIQISNFKDNGVAGESSKALNTFPDYFWEITESKQLNFSTSFPEFALSGKAQFNIENEIGGTFEFTQVSFNLPFMKRSF